MRDVLWMFSGQGSQYFGMGRTLFERERVFRESLLLCDEITQIQTGRSFLDELFKTSVARGEELRSLPITNPALFSVQFAAAQLLLSRGLSPTRLIGYSLGEFVAHAVANAMSLENALRAVNAMAEVATNAAGPPAGGMTAVLAEPNRFDAKCEVFRDCHLAAVNGATQFVVAGRIADLTRVEQALHRERTVWQRLPVDHPFHSPLIASLESQFRARIANLRFQTGNWPVYSSRTVAKPVTVSEDELWAAIREPVRFDFVAKRLRDEGVDLAVDLGPSGTLATALKPALGSDCVLALMSPFAGSQSSDIDAVVARHQIPAAPSRHCTFSGKIGSPYG